MGRVLMYSTIVALAVFVLTATFVLKHGGDSIAAVRAVTVHDLTTNPASYEGDPVSTRGRLSYSDEHERFQIIAAGNFALIIREYHGTASLEDYVGEIVRVSGVFGFDEEFGVYIDADFVEAALD